MNRNNLFLCKNSIILGYKVFPDGSLKRTFLIMTAYKKKYDNLKYS